MQECERALENSGCDAAVTLDPTRMDLGAASSPVLPVGERWELTRAAKPTWILEATSLC